MAVGVRTRFDVFKRDDFTCKYCGKKSPEVVLEVDHIVPVCEGGTDDPINLATSCWDCNHGKAGVSLSEVITGEDPHDRAVMLLERERQLREYNEVLAQIRKRKDADAAELVAFWEAETRWGIYGPDLYWLAAELDRTPAEKIRMAMQIAIRNRKTRDLKYVVAILRNWREEERGKTERP